ncbi:glycosyltransferase family 87 protein [Halorientalis salina]|uniref:glycosyltransferase family 87 protein n=1 Tax=Halorientalis salina TaxID=2932266 RepID=UPI0010AC6F3F|nr:glycosyltransferase family 87 protein [Halorientalis salina]
MLRPLGRSDRLGARLVLGSGLLFGLVYAAYILLTSPHELGIDFEVYYVAARASLAGENFLAVAPARSPDFTYLYPPLTIPFFYPFALLGSWQVGFAIHTLLTIGFGVATAVLLVRYVESRGVDLPWTDRVLIAGFVVASSHSIPSLVFGQVNHHLAFAMTLGFLALERGRDGLSGAAFAAAAFVKVFPAAVGVWLLRQRAWRAVGTAIGTGLGLMALSVLAYGPDLNVFYVTEALLPRLEHEQFLGGLDPSATYLTLRRPLSVLFPQGPSLLWVAGALCLLAPPVAYLYRDTDAAIDRLVAIQGTLVAILLFFPSFPIYAVILYFPLIPLLYLLESGRARSLFVGGALLANLSIRLDDLRAVLELLPVGSGVTDGVLAVAAPVFTVGTPPLYGFLLVLAACVLVRRRRDAATRGG